MELVAAAQETKGSFARSRYQIRNLKEKEQVQRAVRFVRWRYNSVRL